MCVFVQPSHALYVLTVFCVRVVVHFLIRTGTLNSAEDMQCISGPFDNSDIEQGAFRTAGDFLTQKHCM